MTRIAFLGTGAMGSRMAGNLLQAGYRLSAWNRAPGRLAPLLTAGATAADTPAEAARNADIVISMLRDDAASCFAWCDPVSGALAAMKAGAVGIDCSTLSIGWSQALHRRFDDHGIAFLDAPVAGSRPQAESAQLIFFVGGDETTLQRVSPVLEVLGGSIRYAGAAGAGTCVKLAVNALFGAQLAQLGELIGLLDRQGMDRQQAIEILASTPVFSPAAKLAATAMLDGNFAPMFPIELVEKDFSYIAAAVAEPAIELPVSKATWDCFRRAGEKGLGDDNITGIVKLYA